MIEPSPQARQTSRYENKRDAILDAAARVFNDKGLKGATLAEVAAQVGLITTSVTYYYKRKEDLAAACLLRSIASVDALLADAETKELPEDRARAFLRLFFSLRAEIDSGRQPEMMGFADVLALDGRHEQAVRGAYVDMFRRVRRLLRPKGGSPFPRAAENARTHLFLALSLWAPGRLDRYETEDYVLAADRMADILLNGLAAKGSAWAPRPLPDFGPASLDPAEVSREAFLRAATELINDHGYPGASVDKISAKLNVTKGSFYHHNDNKDDLVVDCFERSFDAIRRTQKAAMTPGASGWNQVTAAADTLVRRQFGPDGPLLHAIALSAVPAPLRDKLRATLNRLAERFAVMIVEGVADGTIRPVDPSIAAQLVGAMINGAAELRRWAVDADESLASDRYARPLFTGLLNP
ncbi:MAG: TetR/AcrR family transcriptional regulator [Caulobacteraceae bacterium]